METTNVLVEPRIECINGIEYIIKSLTLKHQNTVAEIWTQLDSQLKNNENNTVVGFFDIYPLYEYNDETTVVIPDIIVFSDHSKLENNRYVGTPKFIIEVLSSNRSHDMVLKFNLYEKAGVSEYWIVDPEDQIITAMTLSDSGYITRNYTGKDTVQLSTIPGCAIDFLKVFEGI